MRPPRVALFTPLPPARTGTAEYAAELVPQLAKCVELKIFSKVPRGFDARGFDHVVYQIANNPWHQDIYELALRQPGIVVLHEPNLHDLIRGMTQGAPERYLREVFYELFGREWDPLQATELRVPGQQPKAFSMLRRLLDRSPGCIVHSRYAESMVRMKGFRGRIGVVPHGAEIREPDGAGYRAELDIAGGARVVGMFGYMRPDKQVRECLKVFREMLNAIPECRMLIAGEDHPQVGLRSEIDRLGIGAAVHVPGFLSLEDMDRAIAACDVVLNLRWPTMGESSGIAARAFGMGRTVIVSDIGANRELPDDTCVKIPCGRYQDKVLAESLRWLLSDKAISQEIGAGARKWTAENCTWKRVAALYSDFLTGGDEPAAQRNFREYVAGWAEPGTARGRYLEDHIARLVRTLQITPAAASPASGILEMGCYLQITPALRSLLGYETVRGTYLGRAGRDRKEVASKSGEFFACEIDLFDCERDDFPYPDEYFDTVLCCELLEHLGKDPMRMMLSIHRVLKPAGILVLSTPNIASQRSVDAVLRGAHPGLYARYPNPAGPDAGDPRHQREYTPTEISNLFSAAGLVVEHIETGPYSETSDGVQWGTGMRGDCILAVGRKADIPTDPYPLWLYDALPNGR